MWNCVFELVGDIVNIVDESFEKLPFNWNSNNFTHHYPEIYTILQTIRLQY